jgi:hypothetical protein
MTRRAACRRKVGVIRGRELVPLLLWFAATAMALVHTGDALAFDFEIGDVPIKLDNLFTAGVMLRMQSPSDKIVAKSNLNPGLCVARSGTTLSGDTCAAGASATDPNPNKLDTPSASNQRFVDAPGSFGINGDNGDLNFKLHDITFATSKLTTDVASDIADFHFFVRTMSFFDAKLANFSERHPDTTLQPARSAYPGDAKSANAVDFRVLDYYVARGFEIGDRSFNLKLGNQVLNWGESSLLVLNSLNSINPLDATRLRAPGFDVKELFRPVGMAVLTGDVVENVTLETFLQYQFKPFIVDPAGSFFSTVDGIGPGGNYLDIGNFGKIPEDPNCTYSAVNNSGDPLNALGSTTCYTIYRNTDQERAHTPKNKPDQFGLALKTFWPTFNNGTEVAFYAASYHSRVPAISAIAAKATCIPAPTYVSGNSGPQNDGANVANLEASCGVTNIGQPMPNSQPLPVDTMSYFLEYPKNVHMLGLSFNTTIGDYAWSGEYAYRPNLPVQINAPDLVFAALQPALPQQDYEIAPNIIIPGRRSGIPDFLGQYRSPGCSLNTDGSTRCIKPGQYIAGYERLKVGQLSTTILRLIGGDNILGASQITLLLEPGMNMTFNLPSMNKLQMNGAGVETHISGGANGEPGLDPPDVQANPPHVTLRQNPEPQDEANFGTKYSYGYRFINLDRYDDLIFGANVQLLAAFFHDVKGNSPGAGQNFVEGRKQILGGVSFDYQSRFIGEVRYTWFTGGGDRDALTDRDNIFVSAGYQF